MLPLFPWYDAHCPLKFTVSIQQVSILPTRPQSNVEKIMGKNIPVKDEKTCETENLRV